MDQCMLLTMWSETWNQNTWVASWVGAIGTLTAAQAAWRPTPGRHCIWQIVNHVCIWREFTLTKFDGRAGPTRADTERDNFAMPAKADDAAWRAAIERLRISHEEIGKAISTPDASMERLPYHLTHDVYHLGQIMYLRATQGLPPVE